MVIYKNGFVVFSGKTKLACKKSSLTGLADELIFFLSREQKRAIRFFSLVLVDTRWTVSMSAGEMGHSITSATHWSIALQSSPFVVGMPFISMLFNHEYCSMSVTFFSRTALRANSSLLAATSSAFRANKES